MRPVLLICGLLLLGSGCAHTAIVKTWEPAEIDVSGLSRVAVLDFTGDAGPQVARTFAARLGSNDFYTVLPPHQLSADVQLAAYAEPTEIPADELLQVARLSSVDAIVRGQVVEFDCQDRQIVEPRMNPAVGMRQDPFARSSAYASVMAFDRKVITERSGVVTLIVQLVDVHSGDVRVSRRITHRYHDRTVGDPTQLPSPEDVLENLTRRCLDDVLAMLAPHQGTCEVQLANCDLWVAGRREVKLGAKLAEEGDWEAAEQRWLEALKINPKNHAALYNLAIEADHRQMYAEAEEYARRALRLHHKDCYAEGLETIRTHRTAFEKSEDQRDTRVMAAASEIWE